MEGTARNPQGTPLLRNFKDSVFTDLFSRKEYTLQLYQALHPEDTEASEDDIEIVTVQNVLTSDQHNDLGFTVGNRLLVLVEAQSTWSPNIVLRSLLYTAQTIKNLAREKGLDIYGTRPVAVPVPELYVVYTGSRKNVPDELVLSEELYGGLPSGVEVRVHVMHEPDATIAGQYIEFAKTLDAHRSAYGPGEDAIRRTIAICLKQGILTEYLKKHEEEVVDIMMTLYDEQEVMQNYWSARIREAEEEATARGLARGMAEGRAKGMAEGRAEGRAEGQAEGEARGIVSAYKDLGASASDAIAKLVDKLGFDVSDAEALVKSLW